MKFLASLFNGRSGLFIRVATVSFVVSSAIITAYAGKRTAENAVETLAAIDETQRIHLSIDAYITECGVEGCWLYVDKYATIPQSCDVEVEEIKIYRKASERDGVALYTINPNLGNSQLVHLERGLRVGVYVVELFALAECDPLGMDFAVKFTDMHVLPTHYSQAHEE